MESENPWPEPAVMGDVRIVVKIRKATRIATTAVRGLQPAIPPLCILLFTPTTSHRELFDAGIIRLDDHYE